MPDLPHIDSEVIVADQLPETWLRAAANRGADTRSLLQGSGMFVGDWTDCEKRITPRHLQRLFRNLCESELGSDFPLILGARAAQLGPETGRDLWSPACWSHGDVSWISWEGTHGDLSMHVSHALAFAAFAYESFRDAAGEDATWSFHFKHRSAGDFPDAWAFLGSRLHFAQPANLIEVRNSQSLSAFPNSPQSFLEGIRHRLVTGPDLTLPACARQLRMSPATLKRRLKQHDTSYQRQIDLFKASRAVMLATCPQTGMDDAVEALGFGTPSNFRRDLRRLLGVTPDDLYAAFA